MKERSDKAVCKYCGLRVTLTPSAQVRANRYGGKPSDYTKLFPVHPKCMIAERTAQSKELMALHSVTEGDVAILLRLIVNDVHELDKGLGLEIASPQWKTALDRLQFLQDRLRIQKVGGWHKAAALMLDKIATFRNAQQGNKEEP